MDEFSQSESADFLCRLCAGGSGGRWFHARTEGSFRGVKGGQVICVEGTATSTSPFSRRFSFTCARIDTFVRMQKVDPES